MSDISPISSELTPTAFPQEAPPPEPVALPRTSALAVRMWSLFSIGVAGSMFAVGMWLQPNPEGTSTHMQLGLPACGFLEKTGYPCPTCGCTTAVCYFSHGHPLASLLTQPFGFAVGVVGLLTILLCTVGAVTGKWIGPDSFTLGWHWKKFFYGGMGIFLGGWIYKIILIRMQLHPV